MNYYFYRQAYRCLCKKIDCIYISIDLDNRFIVLPSSSDNLQFYLWIDNDTKILELSNKYLYLNRYRCIVETIFNALKTNNIYVNNCLVLRKGFTLEQMLIEKDLNE